MKYNNIITTFWFNEIKDFKDKIEIIDQKLKNKFSPLNLIGIPANMSPEIPRFSCTSLGGHTIVNISKINLQIITEIDGKYSNDIELCTDYTNDKVLTLFNVLSDLEIPILYSAININCETENQDSVKKIKDKYFNNTLDSELISEIGLRFSEENGEYYINTSVNNSKIISFTKKIESDSKVNNIIFPLISLQEIDETSNIIAISKEITDKLSFNNNKDYNTTYNTLDKMLKLYFIKVKEISID